MASVYDNAFIDISYDEDGDLKVKEGISCFVLPSEKKDRIQFLSLFGFNQASNETQRLECVNNINTEYIIQLSSRMGKEAQQIYGHILM